MCCTSSARTPAARIRRQHCPSHAQLAPSNLRWRRRILPSIFVAPGRALARDNPRGCALVARPAVGAARKRESLFAAKLQCLGRSAERVDGDPDSISVRRSAEHGESVVSEFHDPSLTAQAGGPCGKTNLVATVRLGDIVARQALAVEQRIQAAEERSVGVPVGAAETSRVAALGRGELEGDTTVAIELEPPAARAPVEAIPGGRLRRIGARAQTIEPVLEQRELLSSTVDSRSARRVLSWRAQFGFVRCGSGSRFRPGRGSGSRCRWAFCRCRFRRICRVMCRAATGEQHCDDERAKEHRQEPRSKSEQRRSPAAG